MRKLLASILTALVVALPAVTTTTPVAASPADSYDPAAPYFGGGNLPPGCEGDALVGQLELRSFSTFQDPDSFDNVCHHMRTGMNGLDSPQVDVLVMVPVSPTAERDMRIMRQSVQMWEGGIDYLATEMGLNWLADGMDFHVTVDYFDPTGDGGGEFTTEPVVDPEIVVIAANPLPFMHAGIGIDPWAPNQMACHPVANPFDIQQWEALPGFNSHHDARSGTYVEDCGATGGGGNTCFAVNAGGDPPLLDVLSLFDLVSHEFGHCLTVGHVGDGAEGLWGATPTNDIMAYSSDPEGLNKCVSTLDVEGVALTMSKYLDTNGDGAVSAADRLFANDQAGQGGNPFQVQHPGDHLYASSTGDVQQCPQPDLGLLPATQSTDWTPAPAMSVSGPTVTDSDPATTGTSPGTSSTDPASSGTSPQTSSDPAPTDTTRRTVSEPSPEPSSGSVNEPTTDAGETQEPTTAPATSDIEAAVTRVEGADRIETSVAASRIAFGAGQAGAVVLARADQFADGLAGTSLAVAHDAPTLLTSGSGLDSRVAAELRRVLPAGREVFVLGGPSALTPEIDGQLESMGYRVVRLAGSDRFETSVRIASAHPAPRAILLATGQNYADALAAGAAAAEASGLVLLTNDGSLPRAVADYLAANTDTPRVAIGGPAALAAPGAERLAGADRFETSVIVARRFFSSPSLVGLASGTSFADALSGGALLGHVGGPLVLTAPNQLSPVVSTYLSGNRSTIDDLFVMGGPAALPASVIEGAREALGG